MEEGGALFTIGQLSRRTGVPVRTIRYWSDIGVLAPAGRTGSGRRRYDPAGLARLELVATLRELGLGLADVRRVLADAPALAEVAALHVAALDAQIATLRLRRAVLATVAGRRMTTKEMTLMTRLAKLSAAQRKQIIDDFVTEVFQGLDADPGMAARLRDASPKLPDDPTPEQVEAWVELAELVQDRGFRERVRAMAATGASARDQGGLLESGAGDGGTPAFVERVMEHAGAALERGVDPASAEAAGVLDQVLAGTAADAGRPQLLAQLEVATDARAERYWQLVAIINGWPPFPALVPAFGWVIEALRAHGGRVGTVHTPSRPGG